MLNLMFFLRREKKDAGCVRTPRQPNFTDPISQLPHTNKVKNNMVWQQVHNTPFASKFCNLFVKPYNFIANFEQSHYSLEDLILERAIREHTMGTIPNTECSSLLSVLAYCLVIKGFVSRSIVWSMSMSKPRIISRQMKMTFLKNYSILWFNVTMTK